MTKTIGLIKIGHIVERSQQLLQSVTVDSCHQLPSGTNREKMNNTGTITALDCSEPTRIPTQDSGIRLQDTQCLSTNTIQTCTITTVKITTHFQFFNVIKV